MYAKSDSEEMSLAASSPSRSPRRPIYFVMSPSQPDTEKLSLAGSSLGCSPANHHHHHHHHSRESYSTTTRFSASVKNGPWRKLSHLPSADADDEVADEDRRPGPTCYAAMFAIGFVVLFSAFSLILWAASKSYKPAVTVEGVVFKRYNVHAGIDRTGVPTKMLSIDSTVRIRFRNRATFFAVHVSATPFELYYYDLVVATGHMQEFWQDRKTGRTVATVVTSTKVPLYGAGLGLTSRAESGRTAVAPLNLTFAVQAKAHVLGKLVHNEFNCGVRCGLHLREDSLGKPASLKDACSYFGCGEDW